MREKDFGARLRDKEEGAIGIGTLIVFIAMILVAAISAAVLIRTSSGLKQQAEKTGSDATDEATGGIFIEATMGRSDGTGIDMIHFIIKCAPGSEGVDTLELSIEETEPNAEIFIATGATSDATLTTATFTFQEIIADPDDEVLGPTEIGQIEISPTTAIPAGERGTFYFTLTDAFQALESFSVPDSLPAAGNWVVLI